MGSFLESVNSILNHKIDVLPKHHKGESHHTHPLVQDHENMETPQKSISAQLQTSGRSGSMWSKLKNSFNGEDDPFETDLESRSEVIPKAWFKEEPVDTILEIEIPIHADTQDLDENEGFFSLTEDLDIQSQQAKTHSPFKEMNEERFEVKSSLASPVVADEVDLLFKLEEEEMQKANPVLEESSLEKKEMAFDKHGLSLARHLSVLEELEKKMLYSHKTTSQKESDSAFETVHYYRNKKGSHLIRPR